MTFLVIYEIVKRTKRSWVEVMCRAHSMKQHQLNSVHLHPQSHFFPVSVTHQCCCNTSYKIPPPPIFTWWKNDLSTTFSICFALVFFLGFTGPLAWTVLLSGHLSCWCWKPSGSMPGGGWQYNSFPCGNNDAELTKKKKIRETYRRMRTTPQLRRALEHQGTHVGRLSANLVSFPRHLLAQVLS